MWLNKKVFIMSQKISIIIPIYNVEHYLKRCLDSVINQNYDDLQIILVDDGSTDGSGLICDEYCKKDSRIQVVHKENGGLSDARNVGLNIAFGDYIMFIDSDDYVSKDFCSCSISDANKTGADIVIFGYTNVYEDYTIESCILKENEKVYSFEDALLMLQNGTMSSFAWNKLYKSSLFKNGIRYPKGKVYEDVGTTYLLFANAKKIFWSSANLYYYQRRNDSITGKKFNVKDTMDWFRLSLERFNYIKNKYPQLLDRDSWNSYAAIWWLCCLRISGIKDASEEYNEICVLLKKHKMSLLSTNLKRKIEFHLFLVNPILFRKYRICKCYFKNRGKW